MTRQLTWNETPNSSGEYRASSNTQPKVSTVTPKIEPLFDCACLVPFRVPSDLYGWVWWTGWEERLQGPVPPRSPHPYELKHNAQGELDLPVGTQAGAQDATEVSIADVGVGL